MTDLRFMGIADVSTVDYIGEVCAVVYLCGCPNRCPWCQNPDLVVNLDHCRSVGIDYILEQLKPNFLIEAVTITGGEPLMQDATIELLKALKAETRLAVKVDTNGQFPANLEKALPFLDFVSMDIKAPLNEGYGKVIGVPGSKEVLGDIRKSLALLKKWPGRKEARTTIVPGLIDKEEDIAEIAKIVRDAGFGYYTLQQFIARNTLDPGYLKVGSPGNEEMNLLGKAAKAFLPDAVVRVVTQRRGVEVIK